MLVRKESNRAGKFFCYERKNRKQKEIRDVNNCHQTARWSLARKTKMPLLTVSWKGPGVTFKAPTPACIHRVGLEHSRYASSVWLSGMALSCPLSVYICCGSRCPSKPVWNFAALYRTVVGYGWLLVDQARFFALVAAVQHARIGRSGGTRCPTRDVQLFQAV